MSPLAPLPEDRGLDAAPIAPPRSAAGRLRNRYFIPMHDVLEILPVSGPVHGTIRPPGSKSITNRALVTAALARGDSRLTGVLDSQDTRVMLDSLQRHGGSRDDGSLRGETCCEGRRC